ncbi:MAG: isoprenylcysteine carboxylmethyltransferase family protein [bacterium]
MLTDNNQQERTNERIRIVIRGFLAFLLMVAAIFLLAGRLAYWQGWVFAGITLIILLISTMLLGDNTDLIHERRHPGPGTKWWDKIFWAFYVPLFLSLIIVACLDGGRFQWTKSLPSLLYFIAYIAYIASNGLVLWAMRTNTWFSSVVRIQTDRNQQVVQDGPYRYVRHPGYVAAIILAVSMALILGSLWALIPSGLVALLLIVRTYLEDITLRNELPGYKEYTAQVNYRLLPGVW